MLLASYTMQRRTPQQRVIKTANSAGVEKPCSRDKGFIDKVILFSRTHTEVNLTFLILFLITIYIQFGFCFRCTA